MKFPACFKILIVLGSLICSSQLYALETETITGKVLLVEGSYLPETASFLMHETDNPRCDSSTQPDKWIVWNRPNPASAQGVTSLVTTAFVSKKSIAIVVEEGTCNPQYIYLKD